MKKWLILDCNYLCHRAKHAMGGLSFNEEPTGAIYGFLRDIIHFRDHFTTERLVFCFDSKTSRRKRLYPSYKGSRKKVQAEKTEEEKQFDIDFYDQIKKLRRIYLPMLGYKNIFVQKGFEGDDVIASICKNIPTDEQAIIISADQDFFQLLTSNISIFNAHTNKIVTKKDFIKKYDITPFQFGEVKTLAGCSSDEVKGVPGVGNKTAIKYLKKVLKPTTKAFQKINSEEGKLIAIRNAPLVVLPMQGTKVFELQKDAFSIKGWKKVCKKLGMASIKDQI